MGLDPRQASGGILLGAVFVLAAAQLMVAPVTGAGWRSPLTAAVFLIAAVPGLHAVHGWLGPVLGHATELADRGPVGVAVAVTSGVALTALATFGVLLPWLGRSAAGQAIRIHASHGFYVGIYAERLVRRTLSARLSTLSSGNLS